MLEQTGQKDLEATVARAGQERKNAPAASASPPPVSAGARGRIFGLINDRLGLRFGERPEEYDPAYVAGVVAKAGRLFGPGAYFGLSVHGLSAIPPAPAMIVSNHSGGTTIPDVWGLGVAWYRHFGAQRPLHVMGHELIFSNRVTGRFFERCGILRATKQVAREVLTTHRRDLLVLPGGDVEVWRPHRDQFKLDFAGRVGYARLAIETQTPIVPVAHAGAHDTLFILSSGRDLARRVGLHRLVRAQVWPIHLSLPWLLGVGPLPHLPLPARMRYRVGSAIMPPPRPPDDASAVAELDHEVRRAIQAQLDALKEEA